jgi:hypothetical protein
MPPKHFERCTPLVWEPVRCNSGWGLQIQNDRSRTGVQAGVISQPSPGQHWGLRPFSPPCSSLRISFVKNSSRGSTGWRIHFLCSRSPSVCTRPPQRHDVESVASAGAEVAVRKHLPRAPFRPASFKVKPRSFKPWNPERYRGGPPFLPGRLTRSAARFGDAYAGANHMC